MLRIIRRITPRSGAVDVDPGQVIFGGTSFPYDPSKQKYHGQKNCTPFSRMAHLFQRNHINSVFVQSAQIIKRVGNTAQCIALVFV